MREPGQLLTVSRRELRIFGIGWILFFGFIGWIVRRASGSDLAAGILWSIGVGIGTGGLLFPSFLHVVYLAWMKLVSPIGHVVTNVVLGAIYFLVLTPIGLAMRAFGRDGLDRKVDPERTSYWVRRSAQPEARRYLRQF